VEIKDFMAKINIASIIEHTLLSPVATIEDLKGCATKPPLIIFTPYAFLLL
jgi:hypothetical protein